MERAGFMSCTAASHQGAIKEPAASLLKTFEAHPHLNKRSNHDLAPPHPPTILISVGGFILYSNGPLCDITTPPKKYAVQTSRSL